MPVECEEKIVLDIPNEFSNGEYELQIAIGGGEYPSVQFADEGETDGAFYSLAKVKIGNQYTTILK